MPFLQMTNIRHRSFMVKKLIVVKEEFYEQFKTFIKHTRV